MRSNRTQALSFRMTEVGPIQNLHLVGSPPPRDDSFMESFHELQ
jgi:hypothetical protein